MHEFPDRTLRPIIHVSKAFNSAQKNYSQIEKEAEVLVFTVKRCHKYLFGRRFEIHTDHKPLLIIFGLKKSILVITASPAASRFNSARLRLRRKIHQYRELRLR